MATVLVVDDADFMRAFLRNILEENGHQVIGEAETGKEAVQKFFSLSPDLVTMDITMPDMSGMDAIKHILRSHSEARIIMCSAMGNHQMILEAIKAGAKDFIVKPFQSSRVIEAIKRVLPSS